MLTLLSGIVFGQHVKIDKKLPIIEEIVSKISYDNIVEMHDILCSFETRNTFSDTVSSTRGIGAARRYIYKKFKEFSDANGGRMKVYFDAFDHELTGRTRAVAERTGQNTYRMVNVVAVLPGKTDDLRFIINGHYDTIPIPSKGLDGVTPNPGANDDASGTVVTMELARVLSQYKFDHTLVFAAFVAEEQGLLGAHHMAQTAEDEGWEIGGVVGDDMVGSIEGGNGIIDGSGVRVFSQGPEDSIHRHFARYCKYVGEPYAPELKLNMIFRNDRFGRGGDHSAFVRRGFTGIRFTELNEYFERQHGTNVDLVEFTSREYMTKVARLQSAFLASAASAPRAITLARPSRDRADYGTVLRWQHETKEKDIAGYKVFIRRTDSGYWQEVIDIGKQEKKIITRRTRQGENTYEAFETKLFYRSIDDYIFGIAAYDTEGNTGIVATYIEPQRNNR